MKRILSFVVVLMLVLGATSLFAAKADWNGAYYVKYRSTKTEEGSADAKYSTTTFQKLELYPTFKLSDKVAVHAGFFWQQFWGAGRLQGLNTSDPVAKNSGALAFHAQMGHRFFRHSNFSNNDLHNRLYFKRV